MNIIKCGGSVTLPKTRKCPSRHPKREQQTRIEAVVSQAFAREVRVAAAMRSLTVGALIAEAVRLHIGGAA